LSFASELVAPERETGLSGASRGSGQTREPARGGIFLDDALVYGLPKGAADFPKTARNLFGVFFLDRLPCFFNQGPQSGAHFLIDGALFQALSVAFDRRWMDGQKKTSVEIVSLRLSCVARRVNAPGRAVERRKLGNRIVFQMVFVTPAGLGEQARLIFHTT
jgi:hypothetical protein